jgi:hypothetical protein
MQGNNNKSPQQRKTGAVISRTTLSKCGTEQDLLEVCMYKWWELHPGESKRYRFAAVLGCSEQRLSQYTQQAKMNGLDWQKIERLMGQRVHRDWLDIQWEKF